MKKSSEFPAEKSKREGQQSHDTSTQDPGLKFLEELDRIPYTYDRVGQVSIVILAGNNLKRRMLSTQKMKRRGKH